MEEEFRRMLERGLAEDNKHIQMHGSWMVEKAKDCNLEGTLHEYRAVLASRKYAYDRLSFHLREGTITHDEFTSLEGKIQGRKEYEKAVRDALVEKCGCKLAE